MTDQVQQRKAMTRALFNAVSPEYDAGPGCFAHFGRRLVEAADVRAGHRVLDVASGRGAVLFPAAERAGPEGHVVGIDIAEEMASRTNEEAGRRGLAARVTVGDAEKLDFPDASFDRVLCGFGLMFFPDQDRALQEMRRVLKPGGKLALTTWQVSQAEELARTTLALGLGSGSAPGWITKAEVLHALIQRNGFGNAQVAADSKAFSYPNAEAYWEQARGTGLRATLDKLQGEEKNRVMQAFVERVKPHLRADGLRLTATALIAVAER